VSIGTPDDGAEVFVRVGRYGPYLEQGERRASVPEDIPPDELTLPRALEILDKAQLAEEPLGFCPATDRPVFVKVGRFGPYVQLGATDDDEKPKNASLLKGMNVEDLDLATALKLLDLPRTLGDHPENAAPVIAASGRFGPYVKWGHETRSLPESLSPLDVTLNDAITLLAQPKTRGRRAVSREPLRVLGESPVTEQPVQLLDGRYGPYVADGVTNASLPKGTTVADVTLEQALEWLADRAAQAPAKKKTTRKKKASAKKKTTKKKPAAKKRTTKKSTAQKSTAKKSTAKKSTAKKSTAKKSTAKKSAAKKSTRKKRST
jgi:DNA topoisomerase-1